ncbi:transposase (plasmid) [Brevibacillus halotolerans]|nr:transposase [Brevibacillus halotolerans]
MTTSTKTIKLEIIKPIDVTWEKFGEILRNIRFQTRFLMNKTIQLLWEYDGFASEYKNNYDVFPKDKDVLTTTDGNPVTLAGFIYDYLKSKHILYSSNASQSQQRAIKRWKSDQKDVSKGVKSIASYKENLPIDLHNKSIEVKKEKNGYLCTLKLLNKEGVRRFDLSSSSIKIFVRAKDLSTKEILSRLVSGAYKIGGSQIIQNKKKWFLALSYIFEKDICEEHSIENILGVDMGIVYPVYMAVNNSHKREWIEGGEIEHFRNKIEKRRISLLRQGKYSGEGRSGHGRATKIKSINVLSDKISNFRKTANFKYAKFVVNFARKNNCGIIQMEDLSGISDSENKLLKNWSYFDLQQKITNKAMEFGIEVRKINPKYTSQRCSCCGHIDEANRPKNSKGQSHFKCIHCGFETNADYNAAKNISTESIELIIENQLKSQNRHRVHHLKYA